MPANMEYFCTTANGKRVVFNPINSHTASHFYNAPTLRKCVVDVINKMLLKDQIIGQDVDMGKVAGTSDVIAVDKSDKIVYAMRKNHAEQGYVPFVKNKEPELSRHISVYLVQKDESTYELSSVWIGEFDSPNFPQMENGGANSIPYWSSHAFVWGSQEIIAGTEITTYPW